MGYADSGFGFEGTDLGLADYGGGGTADQIATMDTINRTLGGQYWDSVGLVLGALNPVTAASKATSLADSRNLLNSLGVTKLAGDAIRMDWTSAAIGGGASLLGSILGGSAAQRAASTQAQAYSDAGYLQYRAATDAAQTAADAQLRAAQIAADAQDRATAELRAQFNQVSSDLAPYMTAGKTGLEQYANLVNAGPGEYTQSPGYQFRLTEGMNALERSAAAKGQLNAPATQKALTEYAQNYATNDYDSFLNRYYQSLTPYQNLANIGLGAAARTGQVGTDIASQIANITQATGTNTANQVMQAANLQGNYLTSGANSMANAATNAANARASGYINTANAYGGLLNNIGSVALLKGFLG